MKEIAKRILCYLLVFTVIITMIPIMDISNTNNTNIFAANDDFTSNADRPDGKGHPYSGQKNWVNIGLRISLYYIGPTNNSERYMPSIAHDETTNKPLMRRYGDTVLASDYGASKNETESRLTQTYYRDKAAKLASILVLNDNGFKFNSTNHGTVDKYDGAIYEMNPASNYKSKVVSWHKVDKKRICYSDCDTKNPNKAFKRLNAKTDNSLKKFQLRGNWRGNSDGGGARTINSDELDNINDFIKSDMTNKLYLIRGFKDVANETYYKWCLNNPEYVYFQIEPVAILSNSQYGNTRGFLTTWSEMKLAQHNAGTNSIASRRGVFSWRNVDYWYGYYVRKVVSTKTLSKSSKSTLSDKPYNVTYFNRKFDSGDMGNTAGVIMGALQNKEIWGHSTQLGSKAYNSCSGIAYYGVGDSSPVVGGPEAVETISLLVSGDLDEESMSIKDGKWTQANALTIAATKDINKFKDDSLRAIQDKMDLSNYIDFANQKTKLTYGGSKDCLYTYINEYNYEQKNNISRPTTVGFSKNSDAKTKKYSLVAYAQFLITNKFKAKTDASRKGVKPATLAKKYDKFVKKIIETETDSDGKVKKGLRPTWNRTAVGAGTTDLNAGYTIQLKNLRYENGEDSDKNIFNVVKNNIVKPAYEDLGSDYGFEMTRLLQYPYYSSEPSSSYKNVLVSSSGSSGNILDSSVSPLETNLLVRDTVYSGTNGDTIANNMLTLGSNNKLAVQAYYLEGVAFQNVLGFNNTTKSTARELKNLTEISNKKKYALNVLVAAKTAQVKSYYTWSIWNFTQENIENTGMIEKPYDITSYGVFPLGQGNETNPNIKGIKRVIIVPNKGLNKKDSVAAISQDELNDIVRNGCTGASESATESQIIKEVWNNLLNKLKDNRPAYGEHSSVRQHYDELLLDYENNPDKFKHSGSDVAAVGYFQNALLPSDPDPDETIDGDVSPDEEAPEPTEDEIAWEDEKVDSETPDLSDDESTGSTADSGEDSYDTTKYANKYFAACNITISEKEFFDLLIQYFKDNNYTDGRFVYYITSEEEYEELCVERCIYDVEDLKDKSSYEPDCIPHYIRALASGNSWLFFTNEDGEEELDYYDSNGLETLALKIIPGYKGALDESEIDDEDPDVFLPSETVVDTEPIVPEDDDTGLDMVDTIEDTEQAKQRGYTIIAIGYRGKRTRTAGLELQPWELNYVYADLQSALMYNTEQVGKGHLTMSDDAATTVGYNQNAYASTYSSNSLADLHASSNSEDIWSYTGTWAIGGYCNDGHADGTYTTTRLDYYWPSSDYLGTVTQASVSYLPSIGRWNNNDTLFSYNIIVSDETKARNSIIDTDSKNTNYTYTVNRDKLHATDDDDTSQNSYSLILYSDNILNTIWSQANNNRGYNNTSKKWSTWSRICKNFNNSSDYQTHYFTVNTMREAAYLSYVYNLIRYISGDERVESSIYNYNADTNVIQKVKDSNLPAVQEFMRKCLLMEKKNIPNIEVSKLTLTSDKVKIRAKRCLYTTPYFKGLDTKGSISEHIILNAYMQDDNDHIGTGNNIDILNKNAYGITGNIYHTYEPAYQFNHSSTANNSTIQWTHNVSHYVPAQTKEHCHRTSGTYAYKHWYIAGYTALGSPIWDWYRDTASYTIDIDDFRIQSYCYHKRSINGVMPDAFRYRTVNAENGNLDAEVESDKYQLDYTENIFKYVTDKMEIGRNNRTTGIIDVNGQLKSTDKAIIQLESSNSGNELVESKTPELGSGNNSEIRTHFASAYFDSQNTDDKAKTTFGYFPEVNMLSYAYAKGQKLANGANSVTMTVVPTMGEVGRASRGANLFFMTTKNANKDYAVKKNGVAVANKENLGSTKADFEGTTFSDSVATSTQATTLGDSMKNGLFNSNHTIRQVIYAGSDVTVTGDANFGLNLYGYSLDLIDKSDNSLLTVVDADTSEFKTKSPVGSIASQPYTYIVADGSDIYSKWYNTLKDASNSAIAANNSSTYLKPYDSPTGTLGNKQIMLERYKAWVKETVNLKNWYADYTLKDSKNTFKSKYTDFSATIGSLKTKDNKKGYEDDAIHQTDVYPLHIKNGAIQKTDPGYVALINQIAIDYFGDSAKEDVVETVTLVNGTATAKLKHYNQAEKLFEESSMGSSIINAIESSNSTFNDSGSCFNSSDSFAIDKRGASMVGSVDNWYDEEVRTIVVRRFKTDTLYFKNITASDKIDYGLAPTSKTANDNWTGRAVDWYLNITYKDTNTNPTFKVTTSQVIGSTESGGKVSYGTTSTIQEFQVVKDLYVDNASFIVPSATTDNMGW